MSERDESSKRGSGPTSFDSGPVESNFGGPPPAPTTGPVPRDSGPNSGPISLRSNEFFAAGEGRPPSTSAPRPTGPIVMPRNNAPWVVTAIVVIVAAVLCGILFFDRRATQDALRISEAARAAAQTDAARAAADVEEQKSLVKVLEEERARLAREKAAQELELAKLKQTQDELEERVRSELITGDVRLTRDGTKLTVDLVDKLLFDSGQADITPKGKEVLGRVGAVLAKVDDRMVQVVGHTDDAVPTEKIKEKFPTNWELSVARATNVVRFLSEESKVPGKRLAATGHGQFRPVATNNNPKGRARNRRIEILLTPLVVGEKRN